MGNKIVGANILWANDLLKSWIYGIDITQIFFAWSISLSPPKLLWITKYICALFLFIQLFPHAPNICFCLQNGELDFSLRTRLQLHRKKVVVQLTGALVSLLCVINQNRYKLIRNKYVACTENCTLCSPRILKSGKGWGSDGKYTWSPCRIGKWLYKFF